MRPIGLGFGFWLLIAAPLLAAEDAMAPLGAPQPPPEAVVGALPMIPGAPTRVMVDLAPEGQKPLVMLLDTGAAQSVLTPGMARSLGISIRAAKRTPYRRATRLGRDLQFWVDTRTSDTGSKTGFEYGLLGGEFLDDYILELDYPGERVRFLDAKAYRVPEESGAPDEAVMRFKRSGTRIGVGIEIDGAPARALLDTGAPPALVLSGRSARKAGLDVDAMEPVDDMGSVMGPVEIRRHVPRSFVFGGFDLGAQPMHVAPKGIYNQGGSSDSLLGYDVLRQFVLRIDYKRKRIWLKRSGDPAPTYFGADWVLSRELGALFIPDGQGHMLVTDLDDGGWARAQGFRAGDVIVRPAGVPASGVRGQVEGEGVVVERLTGEGGVVEATVGGGVP